MGRITIFSLTECPHCNRLKAKLKDLGLKYDDINLSLYPNRRTDMLTLSNRLTVPQVFFNEDYIGGADDTLKWIEDKGDNVVEVVQQQVFDKEDPTNPKLDLPTEPPAEVKPPPPRDDENSIEIPDGTKVSVLKIMELLKTSLPIQERKHKLTVYDNCFTGIQAVEAFKKIYSGISDDDAVKFGKHLVKQKVMHHVCNDHDFENKDYYYRLQCHHQPDVLNSYRVWQERVDDDWMGLLKRLKKQLGKVESSVTDKEGLVDYKAAISTEMFAAFEEAMCEIQGVPLSKMDENMKLAFGINLYNVCIKYAFMKLGIPQTVLTRGAFFPGVKMNVGGDILSLHDLENGVLRSNRKPPYSLKVPFAVDDKRIRLALPKAEPRIHFALNCGAKSCPPVKNFTVHAIEEELRIVALAFCEQDDNVRVNKDQNSIYLSQIFSWYRVDFADSNAQLPKSILPFLRDEKKADLEAMIGSGKSVSIHYNTYDWGTNASDSLAFNPSKLKANQTSIKALF